MLASKLPVRIARLAPSRIRQSSLKTCAARLVSLCLLVSILANSTPAAPKMLLASAGEIGQDVRYAYLGSSLANLSLASLSSGLDEYGWALSPVLAFVSGMKKSRKQAQASVTRIEVSPNWAMIREGEQIVFTAVGYDNNNNPVQGARFNWSAVSDREKSPAITLQNGVFTPQFPGSFQVIAESGGVKGTVLVGVAKDTQFKAIVETDEKVKQGNGEKSGRANKPKALPNEVQKVMEQPLPAPVRNSTKMTADELRELDRWDRENKKRKPPVEEQSKPKESSAVHKTEAPDQQLDEVRYLVAPDEQGSAVKGGPRSDSEPESSAALATYTLSSISDVDFKARGYLSGFPYGGLISLYVDGPRYVGTFIAHQGFNNGMWEMTIPEQYRDGIQHTCYAYISSHFGGNTLQLTGSPKTFTFAAVDPAGWNNDNFPTADDPGVQTGDPANNATDGAGSSNYSFSAPVLSLGGRGDLNLGLSLNYNSLLWHQANGQITYDIDKGHPAPGWNLGFGKLMDMDSQGGSMLETPDGTRHSYEGTIQAGYTAGYSTYYGKTTDGSFIDYTSYRTPAGISGGMAYLSNGTTINYGAAYNGVAYPTFIEDRHGNYISVSYRNNKGPNINTITDNLGRIVQFNYDAQNRLISVTGPGVDNTTQTYVRLHYRQLALSQSFSGLTPIVRDANPYVLDAIYYPGTNTGYWFGDQDSYSAYGMLAKVVEQRAMNWSGAAGEQGTIMPGTINRQMIYNYPLAAASLNSAPQYTQMTESWDRSDTQPSVTTYNVNNNASPRVTTVTLPNGNQVKQYSYNAPGQWSDGLLSHVETVSPQNQILSKSLTSWQLGDYNSPRVTEVNSTDEKNQTTKQAFTYDAYYNQVATVKDYGYTNNLLRTKVNTYENGANYRGYYNTTTGAWSWGRHIFGLVKSEELYDANNARLTKTDYNYDQSNLVDAPGVVMYDQTYNPHTTETVQGPNCVQWEYQWVEEPYDPYGGGQGGYYEYVCVEYEQIPNFDSSTLVRGNVTQTVNYADAPNLAGAIAYDFTYDIAGNQRTATTNCCQQMSFTYTTNTQYSQPEQQTKGSSDPNSPHRMTASATYDFNTGVSLTSTDFNGRTTSATYDALARPVQITMPTGGKKTIEYNDANLSSTETVLLADNQIASKATTVFNGRGQPVNTSQMAGANWNAVAVKYDALGRQSQVSLPYDAAGSPSQWTTYQYDQLSRVMQTTAPDGSQSKTFYNESQRPDSATAAMGQTVRSEDAWGRQRWARTDDFGRLVEVVEPHPDGSGSVFEGGSLQTSYAYDALDQLITVYQGEQQRWFRYDSLGRLTRQKLSEQAPTINDAGQFVGGGGAGASWSDAFVYDNRSNLVQRVDARGVRTNFDYALGGSPDPLNRLQTVSFDKTQADPTYPIWDAAPVAIAYMTAGDKTRVSSVTTDGVASEQNQYDVEGRISDYTLTLTSRAGNPFTTSHLYDTVNRLTEVRYPQQYAMAGNPRKTVNPSYDNASRLTQLAVNNQIQMNEIVYNPLSQVTQLKTGAATGNADVEQYTYDNQTGLLTNQKVIKANSSQTLLDLSYDYNRGLSKGSLNGKTGQLTHIVNNLDRNKDRVYEFDALGRLQTAKGGAATGVGGVQANWTQSYSYDRYGNRETVVANGITANNQTVPTDGLPSLSYHKPSNRINTSGYEYDLAGNQTRGQAPNGNWQRFEYDAAGRLVKIKDDAGNLLESYTYAASRERLINETPNQRTYYAWGGSSVLCEYVENSQNPNSPVFSKSYIYAGSRLLSTQTNNGGVETEEFHHPDRLGTKLVTNNQANTSQEQSTLPFGTSLDAETTGVTNQRFTSYDRSGATGLDYAVNRTYNSGQSRFTQVDPIGMSSASIVNPQSNNLYAYVQNSPIDFSDPTGLYSSIDDEVIIRIESPGKKKPRDWSEVDREIHDQFLEHSDEFSEQPNIGEFIVDVDTSGGGSPVDENANCLTKSLTNGVLTDRGIVASTPWDPILKKAVSNGLASHDGIHFTTKGNKASPVTALAAMSGKILHTGRQDSRKWTEDYKLGLIDILLDTKINDQQYVLTLKDLTFATMIKSGYVKSDTKIGEVSLPAEGGSITLHATLMPYSVFKQYIEGKYSAANRNKVPAKDLTDAARDNNSPFRCP